MTEQELKPLIVQLYTELLIGFDAGAQDTFDEDAVAEGAEMLANEFILGIKEADELDELLSLNPEEIRELFNKKKVISANNDKAGRHKKRPAFVFVALNAHASRTSTRRTVERIMWDYWRPW